MMNWTKLESDKDWQGALDQSKAQPVLVFKHSTRCSVSFMAKKNLEQGWDYPDLKVQPYFLDLISFRSLSNQIAQDTGVRHESPQMILIRNGEVIFHASHYGIEAGALQEHLDD